MKVAHTEGINLVEFKRLSHFYVHLIGLRSMKCKATIRKSKELIFVLFLIGRLRFCLHLG
jgi:hypothetical protein